MALTELFSSSFLIGLAAMLLISSLIMTYISYRMSEQDHKISSMLGLISTMAQELEFFRNKLANFSGMPGGGAMNNIPFMDTTESKLISVSDDDLEESDSDSDSDSGSESGSDSESEEHALVFDSSGHTNDVKILNIHLSNEPSFIDISHELQMVNDIEKEEDDDDDEDDEDSDDEEEKGEVPSSSDDEIKITEVFISASSNVIPVSKTVEVDDIDYKKLTVQQLRNIVLQKGLSEEPNKLKKTDILKILSSS